MLRIWNLEHGGRCLGKLPQPSQTDFDDMQNELTSPRNFKVLHVSTKPSRSQQNPNPNPKHRTRLAPLNNYHCSTTAACMCRDKDVREWRGLSGRRRLHSSCRNMVTTSTKSQPVAPQPDQIADTSESRPRSPRRGGGSSSMSSSNATGRSTNKGNQLNMLLIALPAPRSRHEVHAGVASPAFQFVMC